MRSNLVLSFFFVFILSSCAKTAYVVEQARGQIGLQWNGRNNDEVLADPNVKDEHKEKIKLVEKYRAHFFSYWQRKPDSIYSKTTVLDEEAVSWLVITSPWNEIKPLEECFPFVGCFPYLGFFKKKSAQDWANEKKAENFQTWIRPVYAYSTLGHFEDRILSSFFAYDKYELAELVFHELFHVMYFLKDNVDFNENIANFFGEQMAHEYFAETGDAGFETWKQQMRDSAQIRRVVADAGKELNTLYKKENFKDQVKAQAFMQQYIEEKLRPALRQACEAAKLKRCRVAEGEWNNARLAATMTYEKAAPDFERLFNEHGRDLRKLLAYIKEREKAFKESDQKDFTDFLFSARIDQ